MKRPTLCKFNINFNNNGNGILWLDGATVDNSTNMVSNLNLKNGPTSNTVDIHWNWYASTLGSFTTANGINMKLLHFNGSSWTTIYSERYTYYSQSVLSLFCILTNKP